MLTNQITQSAREFGASRETSAEIAQAIFDMAAGDAACAERIWAEPSRAEDAKVVGRAWAMASADETELFWGQSIIRRGEG